VLDKTEPSTGVAYTRLTSVDTETAANHTAPDPNNGSRP
jgi:hypothetical protein